MPEAKKLSLRDRALILGGVSILLWTMMIVLVIVDICENDRVPDPVPAGTGLLAATATLCSLALAIWANVRGAVDQLAAKLDALEVAFDAGRQFEAVNGRARPGAPRVVREN